MPRYTASGVYPGANRMVNAFANAGARRQQAFNDESKSLANVDYLRARTSEADEKAAGSRARNKYLGDEEQFVSNAAGVPLPLVRKFKEYMAGERAAQVDPQELEQQADLGSPAAPAVPVTEVPGEVSPVLAKLLQAVAQRGTVLAATASNPEQFAHAGQRLQDQSTEGRALAGDIAPALVGAVKAAMGGKALYSDAAGRVLNRFTGALDEEGDQAGANVERTNAQADAATALASERRNPASKGAKPPARIAVINWARENLGMTAEQAAVWEATSKNKSPQALFLDVRSKLATANPALARDPAKLDAAASAAVQAATTFAAQPGGAPKPAAPKRVRFDANGNQIGGD